MHHLVVSLWLSYGINFSFYPPLGLFGPLLICKKGSLDSKNKQKNVDKEFVLHFVVTLEKNSWYYGDNKKLADEPSSIDESMYLLRLYFNLTDFQTIFICRILVITRGLLRESAERNCFVIIVSRKNFPCERRHVKFSGPCSTYVAYNFQRLSLGKIVYLLRSIPSRLMSTTTCSTETM